MKRQATILLAATLVVVTSLGGTFGEDRNKLVLVEVNWGELERREGHRSPTEFRERKHNELQFFEDLGITIKGLTLDRGSAKRQHILASLDAASLQRMRSLPHIVRVDESIERYESPVTGGIGVDVAVKGPDKRKNLNRLAKVLGKKGVELWRYDSVGVAHWEVPLNRIRQLESLPFVEGFSYTSAFAKPAMAEARASMGITNPGYWVDQTGEDLHLIVMIDSGADPRKSGLKDRISTLHGECFGSWAAEGRCRDGLDANHSDGQYEWGGRSTETCFNQEVLAGPNGKGCQHGDITSAVLASDQSGEEGALTVAEVRIMPYKVWNGPQNSWSSQIVQAFSAAAHWVTTLAHLDLPIRVVNFSGGTTILHYNEGNQSCDGEPTLAPLKSAVDALVDAGVFVVAAAGNQSANIPANIHGIDAPGCLQNVIAVTAIFDDQDEIVRNYENSDGATLWAQNHRNVDYAAPGAGIEVSTASGHHGGTSLAAPLVSSVLARLRVKYPNDTMAFIRQRISLYCSEMIGDPDFPVTTRKACWNNGM